MVVKLSPSFPGHLRREMTKLSLGASGQIQEEATQQQVTQNHDATPLTSTPTPPPPPPLPVRLPNHQPQLCVTCV